MPWACCFHCGIAMNTYPLVRYWMQWRLQCFFFKLSTSIFPCPIFSSAKAPEERRKAKTRMWVEQTGPYCTRQRYLGWYFLGCKCSEAGTVSLPVCIVPYNTADLKACIAIQNVLNLVFFPACCLNKPGTRLASIHVILEHKFMQWEGRKVENLRWYSDI